MKILVTLFLTSVITFPSLAASKSNIDVLNSNLTECYEQSLAQASLSKRACSAVIRSKIASQENIAIAYHNRGVINLKLGNKENALNDFSAAALRDPSLNQSIVAIKQLKQEAQSLAQAF